MAGPLEAEDLEAYLGMIVLHEAKGEAHMAFSIRKDMIAPNGFLHAGSLLSLAIATVEHGTRASLPEGVRGLSTIETGSGHLGTTQERTLEGSAKAVHREEPPERGMAS